MPGIPFIKEFKFDYGTAMEVTPLIRRVVAHNPSPFTFKGTGTYIVGRGSVAVIDPGPGLPDHVDALLAALAGETVSHILITHTHLDHSPAAAALKRATEAADGRDVRLGGGVATIRQYLRARLVDEMHLAVAPTLLGSGEHLFSGLDAVELGYRCTEHASAPDATHVVLSRR